MKCRLEWRLDNTSWRTWNHDHSGDPNHSWESWKHGVDWCGWWSPNAAIDPGHPAFLVSFQRLWLGDHQVSARWPTEGLQDHRLLPRPSVASLGRWSWEDPNAWDLPGDMQHHAVPAHPNDAKSEAISNALHLPQWPAKLGVKSAMNFSTLGVS